MKSIIFALSLALFGASVLPTLAEAKRIGGGGSSGMQRSLPARTPPAAAPAQAVPAAPAAPGISPAAAPRRSWMGPLAGLAAGLGIAALMSHFGMGGDLANFMTIALVALAAFIAIRFVMARMSRGNAAPSMATPNGASLAGTGTGPNELTTTPAWSPAIAPASATKLPPGFDAPGFERIAKMIFIRMQAANDSADLNDLRTFTTPEMFASVKLDLQDRAGAAQQTEVLRVDAEVLDVASEEARQIVSVRFHGLIQESRDAAAAPFDEVWHLVRPNDGSREWAIAGIQQSALA